MLLLLLSTLQASGLAATSANAPVVAPPVKACRVFDALPTGSAGEAGMLVAICGGKGVPLGAASHYSVMVNATTGVALVVRQRGLKTQILLASPTKAGTAVDDITRDLTSLTGRFSDLGLGSANVDASQFAISGTIGVVFNSETKWLDVRPYIARAANLMTKSP